MTYSSSTVQSAASRYVVSLHVDRMRYAKTIAQHGSDIFFGPEHDLLKTICLRELAASGIDFGEVLQISGGGFAELDTLRGHEDVYEVLVSGHRGLAVVRLHVLKEEQLAYGYLEEEDWTGLAHNLLTFEVNDDSLAVEAEYQGDGQLVMRVASQGAVQWAARNVEPSFEAIASAVASFR